VSELRIDSHTHIMPAAYFDRYRQITKNPGLLKRMLGVPVLYDIDERLRMMREWPGYQQILTLSLPPIEQLAGPAESPALARLANDGMAQVVDAHRERFPGFVASLPMNNVPAALAEIDRAVHELGAIGLQAMTNIGGVPLDDPRFAPFFAKVVELDLPIWLHPFRNPGIPDYPGESKSQYEIWQVFGWPYETSVAMARIVFSKLLVRHPTLKIITHHLGAMVPYFEGRVGPLWDQLGSRTSDEDYESLLASFTAMGKRPIDFFKLFYGDTAVGGSKSAIRCGLDFFGADRVLFASDCPFDPEKGPGFIRGTFTALDALELPRDTREKLYHGNLARLCRLRVSG
jgi:uncharacterized protein